MTPERELNIRDYARVVLRRKRIILVAFVASVLGALTMSLLQESVYAADAQMLVEPRLGAAVFERDPTLNVQNLERAIQTEIQVLEGQRVRERVRQDLELDELPPAASATPVGSTDVVSVTVRSKDPRTAQIVADAYIRAYASTRREQALDSMRLAEEQLGAKIDELATQIETAAPDQRDTLVAQQATFKERLDQLEIDAALTTGGTSVVKSADLPTSPVEPRPARTAMLAGVVGLLLGLGAAFLVDHLDDSIKTVDDLQLLTESPVLAVVPVEAPPDHRPISISEPHQFAVEIYRGLRTNMQFLGLDAPLRVIQLTSSLPGEGKTTTATNLAVVLGQAGQRTLLIDADLRKPRVHEVFRVPAQPGFTELLMGEDLDLVLTDLGDNLHVVTAGAIPPNPSELLSSHRVSTVLRDLAARYDYVIVDSAPVLPVADSIALARAVDGVLVVAQANRTPKRDVREALARLEQVGATPVGVVLNRAQSTGRGGYGYGYGYGYGGAPEAPKAAAPSAALTAAGPGDPR
jgi:succinoglycan biosynthesis transport protein ExoP